MQRLLFLFIPYFILSSSCFSQQLIKDSLHKGTAEPGEEIICFLSVEWDASFPGGEKAWDRYIQSTIHSTVPFIKGAAAGTYIATVYFIIGKEGLVTEVHRISCQGYGMEEELARVLKQPPRWEPAQKNGRYIRAFRKQEFIFVVPETNYIHI
jgi:hypothetical protein